MNYHSECINRPSSLWERCQQHEKKMPSRIASRMLHSAVIEPVSKRLWILGGLIKPMPIVYIYNLHTTTRASILCHFKFSGHFSGAFSGPFSGHFWGSFWVPDSVGF